MNNAQAELVGRLMRKAYERIDEGRNGTYVAVPCDADDDGAEAYNVNPDGLEAAAEIERMAGVIKALRAALKPFADCMEYIDQGESDEEWAKFRLLIKDYRRAQRVLGGGE